MGYFSNSDHGDIYEAMWCDRCVHQEAACPIWDFHLLWNYEEDEIQKRVLDTFIPRSQAGDNLQCVMFVPLSHKQGTCALCGGGMGRFYRGCDNAECANYGGSTCQKE